jgi:hypothetical protein
LEGDYFEFNCTYPERDRQILTFILQERIQVAKPTRPVFVALRSYYEYSLSENDLDYISSTEDHTFPSLLGGVFFYKNVAFFLDPKADGRFPDFFFPVENDHLVYNLTDDYNETFFPEPFESELYT